MLIWIIFGLWVCLWDTESRIGPSAMNISCGVLDASCAFRLPGKALDFDDACNSDGIILFLVKSLNMLGRSGEKSNQFYISGSYM